MADEPKVEKPKGGMTKIIVIAVVALLAAGGGAVLAMKMLGGGADAKGQGKAEKKAEASAESEAVPLDPFIVNLADPAGNRYLKVTMRVVVGDKEVAESFKNELVRARVRDRIISVLSSKMFQDINTGPGKDSLRRALIKDVNSVLPNEPVQEILFVDFAVQ